ncbi:uncharacterized protein CANTADRAFT_89790 [Suhomyces tanzawaensis NRRL Y-17324]|uniref:Histone deacetylase complex subunit SAP30 Sin3 binding domain-containing protein n=1 Tax=Suhomyces tanzawaensis NRRL Y-17324 TaxID=984487 RepID=A0A1E4SL35_9ASCO|nr:uncharacterized protein CANTADRAFT_89790 [Suhomyces tanzawaensis NRRL Y-17324]ODV80216.1 hypothetical protein CANTADRAFT_89790 [Suhomyces tanzawaensis NRRL Y-17324]
MNLSWLTPDAIITSTQITTAESASESESYKHYGSLGVGASGISQTSSTKSSQKAKTQAALQAQQMYLSKHINSNGPQDKPKVNPLEFEEYDDETLARYNQKYGLGLPPITTINSDILNSEIGKKTQSKRSKSRRARGSITKQETSNHIKAHFLNLPCKENEIITSFLYKVRHQDSDFKLTFK